MPEFNPEIVGILKSHNIQKDEGLLYLLGIYHGLDIETICPDRIIKAMNLTKIIEKDYDNNGAIKWNIPLFSGQEINFEWVTDWIATFGKVNPDRRGSPKDAVKRMKDFFSLYPEYRKDDVYAARDLYIKRLGNPKYCMHSHKFIFDGVGAMKKSTLLQYCEELAKQRPTTGNSEYQRGEVVT